jgi:5-(carboxyamino)imidazole ribonucleotide synthase
MISEAALRQGLGVVVLARSADEPAAIEGVELVIGGIDDEAALRAFVERVDWLTIENELLDLDRVRAALERRPEVPFLPALSGVEVAQDKLEQKRAFERLGIPTAAFEILRADQLEAELARLGARFPGGFVLKWSRGGYDGRGNYLVRDPAAASAKDVEVFCRNGWSAGATIYAEECVDFQCELAMVSTRALDGEQAFFPLVVSRQEDGVCREVVGPATELGIDVETERLATDILRTLGGALELTGTFAVELFLCRDGRVLVNEMAPRVHNTGHYTLFGDEPSQFDLHVQAITRTPLATPSVRGIAAMRNLLGPSWIAQGQPCPAPTESPPPGATLYWYEKRDVSPGRKMGHLTGRVSSVEELPGMLEAMRAYEDQFWARLTNERQH